MAELPRVATELPAKQPESWVYMVRCADGSLYTGWTEDLYARMEAHRTGKGSKCVRGKGFEKLAWAERQPVPGRGPGQRREAQVKALPKAEKEAMAAQWEERMRPRLTMARPADGPEVLALYRWYVLNSTATFNWVPDTEENYIKMVRATLKKAPFLLARDGDGQLLGYACAHLWRDWDAYAWDVETTIYCAPEARGHGVGPMLYNALLALLKAQGYWNAYGVVTSPNPQSDAMHRALGFLNEGTNPRCGYKMGRWLGITTWRAVLHEGSEEPQPVQYRLPAAQVRRILRGAENGGRWQEL